METKTMHIPLLKAGAANGLIVGYASVFNLKDAQGDIVTRGAFAQMLAGQKSLPPQYPPMLWMHDTNRPCGSWLKMSEDVIGLLVHGRLALATQLGQEAYALVKQGAVTGLSIGYRIKRSSYDAAKKARVLHELILDEVSLVTLPANPAARISSVKTQVKAIGVLDYSTVRGHTK